MRAIRTFPVLAVYLLSPMFLLILLSLTTLAVGSFLELLLRGPPAPNRFSFCTGIKVGIYKCKDIHTVPNRLSDSAVQMCISKAAQDLQKSCRLRLHGHLEQSMVSLGPTSYVTIPKSSLQPYVCQGFLCQSHLNLFFHLFSLC